MNFVRESMSKKLRVCIGMSPLAFAILVLLLCGAMVTNVLRMVEEREAAYACEHHD